MRDYLDNFQKVALAALAQGATSVEMATRPCVHGFIENLVGLTESKASKATIFHDVAATVGNRPDWRVEDSNSFGVFVYGDHKNLNLAGPFAFTPNEKTQIERYLTLGRPVFVFDGIEFVFLDPNDFNPFQNARRESLVRKPLSPETKWSELPIEQLVEIRFAELMDRPGFRKWSELELIEQLALRARLLSTEIVQLLESPRGAGVDHAEDRLLEVIHKLSSQLVEHHDPGLRGPQACADFIAQVVVFGLFIAHTQAPLAGNTVEERRLAIREFWIDDSFREVADRLRPFRTIAELLGEILDDSNALALWYRDAGSVLAHAEYFGTTGVPSDFHVLFESFLKSFSPSIRFDYGAWYTPEVLSSWLVRLVDAVSLESLKIDLVASTEKVIDPCVGTGGFLEAFIKHSAARNGPAPELVGFEILPAPYALATYRLRKVIEGTKFEDSLHLVLTDTLADQVEIPPPSDGTGFGQEIIEAADLAKPPLRLVLGNPPSSIKPIGGAPRNLIESKLDDFRPPARLRTDRQNVQKAINNEAYRLVLPGSFVHSVSLRYAREWMASKFDQIWIFELDEDARTGAATSSLFNVLQGRSVLVAVHGANGSPVMYASIADTGLPAKRSYLAKPVSLSEFTAIDAPVGVFAPRSPYPKAAWEASWPMLQTPIHKGIFISKCSGVKLGLTALFNVDPVQLLKRSKAMSSMPLKSFAEIKQSWFAGQAKPPSESKLNANVRAAIGDVFDDSDSDPLVPYTFRPFVTGRVIADEAVFASLSTTSGGGTRSRPEVRLAFSEGASALLVAPGPRDLGRSLTRFVSFAWSLPDNDNASRGNSMAYCSKFPLIGEATGLHDQQVVTNTSGEVNEILGRESDPANDVLYYCYAVMSSSAYLEAFEAVLYVPSDPQTPFRVPIAQEKGVREQLTAIGAQLAECENFEIEFPINPAITAVWPIDVVEMRLISETIDVSLGILELKGDSGEIVKISGVSAESLTLRIAGHEVLKKWVRERKFSYLRRTFRKTDLVELLQVISRLERQVELVASASLLVEPLLQDTSLLLPPPARVTP